MKGLAKVVQPDARFCHNRSLVRDPNVSGTAGLELKHDGSAVVVEARASLDGHRAAQERELSACLVDRLSANPKLAALLGAGRPITATVTFSLAE